MKIGIVVGRFLPLHIGHVNLIQRASGLVDKVYVVVSYSDKGDNEMISNSRFIKPITPKDRLRFVKQTFKNQNNIFSFLFDESGCPPFPEGWEKWSALLKKEIEVREPDLDWENDVLFISNRKDDTKYNLKYFNSETKSIDPEYIEYPVNSWEIRENPSKYWEYLPREVREHLIPIITICGGESSGKSIMIDKLANVSTLRPLGNTDVNMSLKNLAAMRTPCNTRIMKKSCSDISPMCCMPQETPTNLP